MNLAQCRRILIFGGAFDPPTRAHVQLPLQAARAIDADCLLYVPTGHPPHKDAPAASAAHRLAMLRLALQDANPTPPPWVHVWTDEIDRAAAGQSSYTIDTLTHLREHLGPDPELRLLIGADQLRAFDTWRAPERIIQLAPPLVMVRPPDTRQSLLENLPPGYAAADWEPRLIELPLIDVSSTIVRQRVRRNQTIDPLVPPAVAAYIQRHGLYRG